MKKHKILSLLLALVLAFSAAGTAFAASHTVAAGGFGKLTGTIIQNPTDFGEWSVNLTASINKVLTKTTLSMGVHWEQTNDPTYTVFGDDVPSISQKFYVPFSMEWAPTEAYGYYEVYAPGEKPYSTYAETSLTRPA